MPRKAPGLGNQRMNEKDMYWWYVAKLLAAHPEYWTRYNRETDMRHCWVYTQVDKKVIEVISWPRFKKMVAAILEAAADPIIKGTPFYLGPTLGSITPRVIERIFDKKIGRRIDWKSTMAMWKEKGERKGLITHLDSTYVRIGWKKIASPGNGRFYEFKASRRKMRPRFSEYIAKNPEVKLNYEQYPIQDRL